jgi:SpoVK/Ycf46/Vps4 family AAA+-type ATPase
MDRYELTDTIAEALQKESSCLDDIRAHILGNPVEAKLKWNDFSHLGNMHDQLALFLSKSIKNKVQGINILLWGEPGTGKTEFCKTLAQQIGLTLYAVGETDDEGDEPTRTERVDALRLAQSLLHYQNKSFIMFDEMDDLFERSPFVQMNGGKFNATSKIFLNRLFENNPTPTIWIINEAKHLDETVIRRMSLVLEIKRPPQRFREAIWKRIVTTRELDLPEHEIKELARLDISPAILDSAVQFAQITEQGQKGVLFASRGFASAMQGKLQSRPNISTTYCPELLNSDTELIGLGDRLIESGRKDFSLCLYGAPGTGKTEYVRQLANQLDMEVLLKKTSDLMSPYVGENEKNIAAAFQQAIENDSFLVFDEADSLLGDRRHAVRSWEVSLVNEMLAWMEAHPLPFACTTNLMERLDQASLRRFTFKIHLQTLSVQQNRIAFENFFGQPTPEELPNIPNLTPGDYSVVRKKAEILGILKQPEELFKMLLIESDAKESTGSQIGFAI